MPLAQIMMFGVLGGLIIVMALHAAIYRRDPTLAIILLASVAVRLLITVLNNAYGPLPGAEVDAVRYEAYAYVQSVDYHADGTFVWDIGRMGYSNILAWVFILGGYHPLLAGLANAVVVTAFLLVVHSLASLLTTRARARLITAAVAFYPSVLLYTAVPLREAFLMLGTALFVLGVVRHLLGKGSLINWRIVGAYALLVWLHAGFVVLAAALPLVLWIKGVVRRDGIDLQKALPYTMLALVAGGVLVVLVSKLGGSLPKLPEDPVQLLDVGYIGDLRSYKSSYGSGYTVETATSWFGFIVQLPVIVFRFLFSPTPFDAIRGSSPIADGVKMIDSFLFLGMMVAAWRALRRPLDTKTARQTRLAITALFVLLVVVFAIGTSNVGIAVRHRAKFAWLLLVVIGVWRHRRAPATATVESVRRPVPAAVSV